MAKKIDLDELIRRCKVSHGDKYDYSLVEYVNSKIKIKIGCPVHGIFKQLPLSHAKGEGCRKCYNDSLKTNHYNIIKSFKDVHGDKYDYSLFTDYQPNNTKIKIICPIHGVFEQLISNHKSGNSCNECSADKQKSNIFKIIKEFKDIHGDKYDYSLVEYINAHSKIKIKCPEHGVFEQRPNNHKVGIGCPKCAHGVVKRFHEHKRYGDDYEKFHEKWISDYNKYGLLFCKQKYGISDTVLYKKFIPKKDILDKSTSLNERMINEVFDLDFETNVRKILPSSNHKEIDLLNREHMISIEFNGVYWHQINTDRLKDDLYKAEEMRNLGYKHFALDETDMCKLELINKMINPNKTKLYARKLTLKSIKNPKEFLDRNHLQGNVNAKMSYGLFLDDELIQTMTFGKSRFDKSIDWEILRLCTKTDYLVIGGAERLFKAFIKEHSPKSIVSYSDNKYFDGSVYKKLGLEFVENTTPNYVWYKNGISLKRYQTMKHKLFGVLGENFDPKMTEKENMINNGWRKVKDLGNKKWCLYK